MIIFGQNVIATKSFFSWYWVSINDVISLEGGSQWFCDDSTKFCKHDKGEDCLNLCDIIYDIKLNDYG